MTTGVVSWKNKIFIAGVGVWPENQNRAAQRLSFNPYLVRLFVVQLKRRYINPYAEKGLLTTPWRHTHKLPISLRELSRDWFYDHIQSGSKSKCNGVSQPPGRLWHSITLGLWPRCLQTSKFLSSVALPRNCKHNVFSFRGSFQKCL